MQAGPLAVTLPAPALDRIDRIWNEENSRRGGRLFNGRLFTVQAIAPDLIIGGFVEYRWYIAQRQEPGILGEFIVHPLGITGIITTPDGIIFGKRSRDVTDAADCWELVPSGGIDSKHCQPDQTVLHVNQLYDEIQEELGISVHNITEVKSEVILQDCDKHVIEICMSAKTDLRRAVLVAQFHRCEREHSLIKIVNRSELNSFVRLVSEEIVPESRELLRLLGML